MNIYKRPKRLFVDIVSDDYVFKEFSIFMTEGCYKFKNLEYSRYRNPGKCTNGHKSRHRHVLKWPEGQFVHNYLIVTYF